MIKITLNEKRFSKNPNTKTTYFLTEEKTREITEREYQNIASSDTLKFFRRLGGSESAIYGYTCNGYKITKLTSTSPDKSIKVIRKFNFEYLEN